MSAPVPSVSASRWSEIKRSLDPDNPTPLYHQIVMALRWAFGTGGVTVGDRLPSAREASDLWNVNYHTVLKAYRELERVGLVRSRRGEGTTLIALSRADDHGTHLGDFLIRVRREAKARFGVDVAGFVEGPVDKLSEAAETVSVVECNNTQCVELAEQLSARLDARVVAWSLHNTGEPPPGPIVSTYFHFAEVRERWPGRLADMSFMSLRIVPRMGAAIGGFVAGRAPTQLVVVELEFATGRAIANDVADLLGGMQPLPEVIVLSDLQRTEKHSNELWLSAPRVWDKLREEIRQWPNIIRLEYEFVPKELDVVAPALRQTGRSTRPHA